MSSFRKLGHAIPALAALLATASLPHAQCELRRQELGARDGQAGDAFGYRMARSGDLLVVAAPFDDDLGRDAGSAYVYERDPIAGWLLAQKLLPSRGAAGEQFGWSVAVAGETVLVGAPGHDARVENRGVVYAYERDRRGIWREVSRLVPLGAGSGAGFGYSMAAHGERVLVGMPYPAMPVPGAAFLYRRDASLRGWALEREFSAADPATRLAFGSALALADDVLAVTGSTGNPFPYSDTYVVHVRERNAGGPGNWGEVKTIASPTGTRDLFAYKLALDGETLAAVAPAEMNPRNFRLGAVYLYARGGGGAGGWNRIKRLHSANALDGAFAAEVPALHGAWLVAGLPTASSGGTVHVFGRNVGGPENWGEVTRLELELWEEGAGFGQGLALAGDELLVSASGYSFSDTGGEVYVYDLARAARTEWRGDSLGANVDSYRAGTAVPGEHFVATVDLATTGHPLAVLSCFTDAAEIVLPGGQVLLGQNRCHRATASGPLARFEVAIPSLRSLCGLVLRTQAAHVGGTQPFVLTNAQDVVLGVR
jgi:hypothetical protein